MAKVGERLAGMAASVSRRRVPSHGLALDLRHPDIPAHVRTGVMFGRYETDEIGLVRRHLTRSRLDGLDVVELGAGYGIVTAHLVDRLGPQRRLVAVEGDLTLVGVVRAVVTDERVTVVHGAVDHSDNAAITTMHLHPLRTKSRLLARAEAVPTDVPRIRLGPLLDTHGIDGPYALVMDIEGGEAGVLFEDHGALDACAVVVAELHHTTYLDERVEPSHAAGRLVVLGFEVIDAAGGVVVAVRPGR